MVNYLFSDPCISCQCTFKKAAKAALTEDNSFLSAFCRWTRSHAKRGQNMQLIHSLIFGTSSEFTSKSKISQLTKYFDLLEVDESSLSYSFLSQESWPTKEHELKHICKFIYETERTKRLLVNRSRNLIWKGNYSSETAETKWPWLWLSLYRGCCWFNENQFWYGFYQLRR